MLGEEIGKYRGGGGGIFYSMDNLTSMIAPPFDAPHPTAFLHCAPMEGNSRQTRKIIADGAPKARAIPAQGLALG
jgi:hypothetical protein